MPLIVGILILVVVVIILTKADVAEGIISAIVSLLAPILLAGGTAAVASLVATPLVGIPLGVFVFFAALKKFR